ncbi:MAG: hypothetical protein IAF02_20930, partial [Anaerolineae bacterium]|nr:hypothetical protein [Anaerolineae bacterium]
MKTTYYQLSENSFITVIDWPGWDVVWANKDAREPYWIVVEDVTPTDLAERLKNLNLHPLMMEDCSSPDHSTLVDRYSDAIYIEFPTNADCEYGEVAYLSILCLSDLIIAIKRGEVEQLPSFITSLQQDHKLIKGNTANLLYLLIDFFTDKTITKSLVYRQQLNRL